jgi:hypothetical protein
VRGFAVTLILGILTSIFTAIVVTRVFVDLVLESSLARYIQSLAWTGRAAGAGPAVAAGGPAGGGAGE